MTAIQAIYIRGHEERSEPKQHTVYRIEIQAHVRSWQMWRRYSEFVDLNTELTKSTGSAPPAPLPPKHSFALLRSRKDDKLVEERRAGLEAYLRAIIGSREDKWRDNYALRDFLGVPIGRQSGTDGSAPSQYTSSSWLDEHLELQTRIRDVRADINKRDALSDSGDVAASHTSNVQAKKKLAYILTRVGKLAEGLETLGLSGMAEGELQRRTDMVARLQDDSEKLGKMVTVARQTSRVTGLSATASGPANPAPESDRAALLGTNLTWNKPVTRVFGASSKPQETEQTRPLDDHGLLQLQQEQVNQQDAQLSQLSAILARQRHLGVAIGTEIMAQNELLDDLSNDVDRFGDKLTTAKRQLNRLG